MKKTLTITTVLLLLLSGCAESRYSSNPTKSNIEINSVKFFTEVANNNDAELFLTIRHTEPEAEILNSYMDTADSLSDKFVSLVTYDIYNSDAEQLLRVNIYEYEKKFDEDDLYTTACMINNTVVQYGIFDEIDEDDTADDFEDFCEDNDGKFYDNSIDWDYDDEDYEDDDDNDIEFKY